MKRYVPFVFGLLVVMSLLLAACQPAAQEAPAPEEPVQEEAAAPEEAAPEEAAAEESGTVKVVTDATWPPFETVDEQTKELIGFDVDLIAMIAERAGFEYELMNIPFDSALAGLSQCQYDAGISAITITEERAQTMAFSDPYYSAGQVVSVRFDEEEIGGPDDLSGKSVGAQIGTTGAIEAEEIEGVEFKAYDTIDLAFLDLMNGQIDAVIADNTLADGFIQQNPDRIKTVGGLFTDESYGIALCKERTDLQAQINQALAELKEEGAVDELVNKWIVGE